MDMIQKLLLSHVCELVDALGVGLLTPHESCIVRIDLGNVACKNGSTLDGFTSGSVRKVFLSSLKSSSLIGGF